MTATIQIDLPGDLARFRLPAAVAARLHSLLDERSEAKGLVDLAELLTLLRMRAERAAS